jgi:hypothetical protein
MPKSPSVPFFFTASAGKVPSLSQRAAIGSSSFFAKSRAISRIISCSFDISNAIVAAPFQGL